MTDQSDANTVSASYEADERIAARAAVAVADEKWRSLCTEHASSFVAAERRSIAIQAALKDLLNEMHRAEPSIRRVQRALDPKAIGEDDGGYYDEKEDEEDEGRDSHSEGTTKRRSAASALADLAEKHRLRRRTLMQHSSLLELLELPSLMDACVRSSLYDDALSIAGFANTLERKHLMDKAQPAPARTGVTAHPQFVSTPTTVADANDKKPRGNVVASVVSEIRRREVDLRRQLIHRLRGDVTMPQCLEVVTALRRLNGVELERQGMSFSSNKGVDHDLEGVHAAMEMRLQVDFFEARDVWLEAGVNRIGSAAAAAVASSITSGDKGKFGSSTTAASSGTSAQAEQILDGIERYRTRCFEIVTQFQAIFRGSFAPSSSNKDKDHSFTLLSMWTARRIQTFLSTLDSNIVSHVHDTATLRDALDSASFFASSMGRVGADFQSLLAPIFESRLTEMVVVHWTDGLNGMTETLKACRDAGVAGPLFGTETSSGKEEGEESKFEDSIELRSSRTPTPPRKLLGLPPLARFLNAYLRGLNELRRCLLPGSFPQILAAQRKLTSDTKMALQANERAALTPGLRGEASKLREVAAKMKAEFDSCVEPYMNQCLEIAFGSLDFAIAEAEKARALEQAKAEAAEKARLAAEEKAKAEAAEQARLAAEEIAKNEAKLALENVALEEADNEPVADNNDGLEVDETNQRADKSSEKTGDDFFDE